MRTRPCVEAGCPNLVQQGSRCPSCYRKHRAQDVEKRGTSAHRGYDADWRVVRDAYARAHPLCEDCADHGIVTPLNVVDHVIPLPHGPRLDPTNLRSLCTSHHALKTAKDAQAGYAPHHANTKREEPTPWLVR